LQHRSAAEQPLRQIAKWSVAGRLVEGRGSVQGSSRPEQRIELIRALTVNATSGAQGGVSQGVYQTRD
jgi:hypothetical protein